MITDKERKGFSILFFLFGVFYIIAFASYILKNDLVGAIFCAMVGIIVFFISFLVAIGEKNEYK